LPAAAAQALFGEMGRPNILWIVATQWRATACGYAGDANARTPHLDALAAQGVDYAQAVTPHPFGPFARAALLTGLPSPANGVRDYFDPLPADARTIAHEMTARGYATAFFGKWHLAPRDRQVPLVGEAHAKTIVPRVARGGFEVWDGFEGGFLLNDPWLHGRTSETPERVPGYQSDVVCQRAGEFLQQRADARPWFAIVSLEPPHPPYDAPAPGVPVRDPREIVLPVNVPRGGEVERQARRELAGYYAHIEATDRALGRILLPALPANTVVVFTSVHGDMHGAHGLFRKGWPHEESIRVPLLVRPASVAANAVRAPRSDAVVSLLDLPGWTMAWADGREPHAPTGGIADGEMLRISMPSVVALPHQCDRVWRGGRGRERKLVVNDDGSPWLYFNLAADPLEQRNLVGEPRYTDEIRAGCRQLGLGA
jgi:arylsulfatase A-like enzyme